MLFDTPIYFIFLFGVVVAYWRFEHRQQNILLLVCSYFFYGWWDWRFLALILTSTVVDFSCARWIAASSTAGRRKLLLTVSLVLNLSFLGFFKYFDFFIDSLVAALQSIGIDDVHVTTLRILLPPGISFYTFQEIAYVVDVYNRRIKATNSLVDYALFICLFPHLIAGPIQRPSHLLPQVQTVRSFDTTRFFDGLLLILSGLVRKCVVADNCALLANAAFSGRLGTPTLPVVAIGAYAFAWQIYGDFSGYTNIARGSAQLLGFHFMVNFKQPYLATSLQDFWRRWHISLSTWLRDYLYIPLGGSRLGEAKTYRNLLVTMLLGGLWHGANWTFVVWGGIHGVGLALERIGRGRLGWAQNRSGEEPAPAWWRASGGWAARIVVFHLVCLAWIFFRAQSTGEAIHLLGGLGTIGWRPEFLTAFEFLGFFTVPLFLADCLLSRRGEEYLFEMRSGSQRVAYALVLLAVTTFFSGNQINAFIYFRF